MQGKVKLMQGQSMSRCSPYCLLICFILFCVIIMRLHGLYLFLGQLCSMIQDWGKARIFPCYDHAFLGRDVKIYMMLTAIIHSVTDITRNRIIRENHYTLNAACVTHLSTDAFFTLLDRLSNLPGYSCNTETHQLRQDKS